MARAKATDVKTLIDTAARLFSDKGYQNTTIDDLAREARISKPTLYQYVEGKEFVLESIFNVILTRLKDEQVVALASSDVPEQQLKDMIHGFVRAITDLSDYYEIYFSQESELSPRSRKRVLRQSRDLIDNLAAVLAKCGPVRRARGERHPMVEAFFLTGMLVLIPRWYDKAGSLSPERVAEFAIAFLSGGVFSSAPKDRTAKRTPMQRAHGRAKH